MTKGRNDWVRPGQAPTFKSPYVTPASAFLRSTFLGFLIPSSRQSEGFVDVQSQPNQGTTFLLYFPTVAADHPPNKLKPWGTQLSLCNESILVVDDDLPMLEVTKRLLEAQGFKVFTAENGEHALVEAERIPEPIALLLTDLKMPRLNGRELAKLLTKYWPGLRVLFMSGNPCLDCGQATGEERAPRVLPKPFSREELIQAVRSTLDVVTEGAVRVGSPSPTAPAQPRQWLLSTIEAAKIQSAVMAADYQALVVESESYAIHNPEFAMRMRALVERFEYEAILDLFQVALPRDPAAFNEGKL